MWRGLTVKSLLLGLFTITLKEFQVAQAVNGGKVFALGFFNITSGGVGRNDPIFEEIFISCFMCETLVKIYVPGLNFLKIISLDSSQTNGWYSKVNFTQDISTAIELSNGKLWHSAAVLVSSSNASITVQVNKARPGSSAAYLAFPMTFDAIYATNPEQQIYDYYVASYTTDGQGGHSIISIVSIFNNTCVTVFKTNNSANSTIRFQDATLQANDVLNLYASSSDFTGVVVRSRKPIGVFTGVDNAQIPVNVSSTDAIMEQVPKQTLLGSQHILTSIPGFPYNVGFRYRVIGASTSSPCFVSISHYSYDFSNFNWTLVHAENSSALQTNQYLERTVTGNFTAVIVDCGAASCMVVQYAVGVNLTGVSSDPAMLLIPPVSHYTKDITFSTSSINNGFSSTPATNYIAIIANTASYRNLQLDGGPISTQWIQIAAPLAGYYVTSVQITDGFHMLTTYPSVLTGCKYIAFVFGSGFDNQQSQAMAYAYLAGFEIPDSDLSPVGGPWYDMSTRINNLVAAPQVNSAASKLAGSSGQLFNDSRPAYGLVFGANFSTLWPYSYSDVPTRICSNGYADLFKYRISSLALNLSNSAMSLILKNLKCSVPGLIVNVALSNSSTQAYFSEYSRSGGTFSVTVTATQTATLNDIYTCATSSANWFQDPYNWVPNYDRKSRNFLDKFDTSFPGYADLQTCAVMFVSNSNGLFSILSRQWTCPSNFNAAANGVQFHSLAIILLPLLIAIRFR